MIIRIIISIIIIIIIVLVILALTNKENKINNILLFNITDPIGIKNGKYKKIPSINFFSIKYTTWNFSIKFNLEKFNNTMQSIIGNVDDSWGLWINPKKILQWRIGKIIWDLNNLGELNDDTPYEINIKYNINYYFNLNILESSNLNKNFKIIKTMIQIVDSEPINTIKGFINLGGINEDNKDKFLGSIYEVQSFELESIQPITIAPKIFTNKPTTIAPKIDIDNELIIAIGMDNNIWTKKNLLEPWVGPIKNSCCIKSITYLQNGTFVGISLDGKIYTKKDLEGIWLLQSENNCCIQYINQLNDGTIVGIKDNLLYKKNSLTSPWIGPIDNTPIQSIAQIKDGAILGVGKDNYLYTKNNLNENWIGPIDKNCCINDIAILNNGIILGINANKLYKKNNLVDTWNGPLDNFNIINISVKKNNKKTKL